MLDSRFTDSDADEAQGSMFDPDDDQQEVEVRDSEPTDVGAWTAADFETRAAEVYAEYSGRYKTRFSWLRPDLFSKALETDLRSDIDALLQVLQRYGTWDPAHDTKLKALQASPDRDLSRQEDACFLPVRRHRPLSRRST